ncbi:CBU_0592 family membrane protein [Streptosporangium saharense]|uniref:CBU_0592 family membrane protein n=1 Tax=Streptosporangium saharense TaxID=1706840 RepID=UPI00343CDC80
MPLFVDLLGWISAAVMLYGYAMVSSSRMAGDGLPYQVINLVGSVALMVSATSHSAWPSAILNVAWAMIGVAAVIRNARGDRRTIGLP